MIWRKKIWNLLEEHIFPALSGDAWYNPYRDAVPAFDLDNAPVLRRKNLRLFLDSIETPEWLLVGEALGPRGGRFSGVPFMSESQVCSGEAGFRGNQTSVQPSPLSERTANIFWDAMSPWRGRFLTWNAYPLHPHRPGELLSIRAPSAVEIRWFLPVLREVAAITSPRAVFAIGRKAEKGLCALGIPCIYIRHPSHGGEQAFRDGIKKSPLGSPRGDFS